MIDPDDIDGLIAALRAHPEARRYLAFVPVDDLIDALRPHLDAGVVGYAGLFSSCQLNYHGMWSRWMDFISARLSDEPERYWPLKAEIEAIVDSGALPPAVFAVHTAYHGKTAHEDHQSFGEAA